MDNYRENAQIHHFFPKSGVFDQLHPSIITSWAEKSLAIPMDGTLEMYNSYVNRVFGLKDQEGNRWIFKCYRPDRWKISAIEEEHDFLFAAEQVEIPVVAPVLDPDGYSLHLGCIDSQKFAYACFPLRAGRTFEPISADDYRRLGSLIARVHCLEDKITLIHRNTWKPEQVHIKALSLIQLNQLGEVRKDFVHILTLGFERAKNLFLEVNPRMIPIHGDVHRSNILDRDGLLLFDFDDAMIGPAIQDLWMLTPDRYEKSLLEWDWIQEGYNQFRVFPQKEIALIESLRFMRMVYFLSWQSIQSEDQNFLERFPQWGTKAFWEKEIEDLWDQYSYLEDS